MVKAVVSGAAGRMGSRIITLIKGSEAVSLHGALEFAGFFGLGSDIGEITGLGRLGVTVTADVASALEGADVLIDFTKPEASLELGKKASEMGVALVIGTTGLNTEQIEKVQGFSTRVPCVFAPNMSVGVNLLLGVLANVARVLGDEYDVEIVEAHHRMKKDAPSGTAVKMAEVLAEALNRDLKQVGVYGRQGMVGERPAQEIGIHTVRGGDIVGEHTVLFAGIGERIEITHRASSRDTFAKGAVRAAAWVAAQKPGLYSMKDVLGL